MNPLKSHSSTSSVVDYRKKKPREYRPSQRRKKVFKEVAARDQAFLNEVHDGLMEYRKNANQKHKVKMDAEEERLYEEACRTHNYPYMCGAHKELKKDYGKDYRFWQAVDYRNPSECQSDVDVMQVMPKRRELQKEKQKTNPPPHHKKIYPNKANQRTQSAGYNKNEKAYEGDPRTPEEAPSSRPDSKTSSTKERPSSRPVPRAYAEAASRREPEVPRETDLTLSQEEKNKLALMGNKMLERDYHRDFKDNYLRTIYDMEYKKWNKLKEEQPVWAEKTFKSLGAGFWNLPFNKDEGWKKREQMAAAKEKTSYEREARRRVEGVEPEKVVREPFIATHYPTHRMTPAYMSQYNREYYRKPFQKTLEVF